MRAPLRAAIRSAALAACAALVAASGPALGQDSGGARRQGGAGGAGGGGRGGPAGVFRTDVPPHDVDVIAGRPTRNSVVLSVRTAADAEGCVEWRSGDGAPRRTPVRAFAAGVPSEVLLDGLAADAAHTARVLLRKPPATDFSASDPVSFRTQRPAGAAFTFAVQSDSHLDVQTQPELYERTVRNVAESGADFLFDLGDTFMVDKRREDFRAALPQYAAQRWYMSLSRMPVFLVLGNHDGEVGWRDRGGADDMPRWSAVQRTRSFPNPVPDAFYSGNEAQEADVGPLGNWYAFEWGDALFVALDPFRSTREKVKGEEDGWAWTLGESQHRWFAKTLAASRAKFRFVMIHHLVGGLGGEARGGAEAARLFEWGGRSRDGKDDFAARRPGWAGPVHELLRRAGPSVVLHGHDHFFAHQEADGVVYQMVPQPGHPGGDAGRMAAEYGYLAGDFLPSPGFVRIAVSPDAARVELVRTALPAGEARTGVKNASVAFSYSVPAATRAPR